MRLRDGKVRLDRCERRIGNFVIRDEETHVKVMDINQVFTHRASKRTPVGAFLKACFDSLDTEESTGKGLGNWLAVIFTAFSVVPDVEWLTAVMEASEACMRRHPEAYGLQPGDGTDGENEEAAREVREMAEFEDEVGGIPDGVFGEAFLQQGADDHHACGDHGASARLLGGIDSGHLEHDVAEEPGAVTQFLRNHHLPVHLSWRSRVYSLLGSRRTPSSR